MVERIIMCIENHVQHLGITEPISLGGPTEHDVMQTHELEKFLADADLYESHEESIGREEVLGRLDQIVKIWVKTISRAKGLNEQLVQEANAKIFTFGSYRLGVDESVHKLDSRVPPAVKQLSSRALIAAQDAPATARAVVSEVKNVNLVDTASGLAKTAYAKCDPAAKGMYMKYEPVAKQYAASTWHSLNQLPLFPRVAQVVVPTAAYCSEKYNETVQRTAKQGYKVSSYLPLVPTEKIAKVFSGSNSQTEMIDTGVAAGVAN